VSIVTVAVRIEGRRKIAMQRYSHLFAAATALAVSVFAGWLDEVRVSARAFASDRLSVVTRGKGPDIVLIPGLASHRDVWASAAALLEDRYRLHLVQVNGFAGFAPGANVEGPVSAPVAEELARYIRETDIGRPAVIGHSMGGTMGMMIAARHPDVVGRLMIVDTVPFMGVMFGSTTAEGVNATADGMRAQILAEPLASPTNPIAKMFPTMTRAETMQRVLLEQATQSDPRTVATAFHEVLVTDLRPELARISAPITVLYAIPSGLPMPPDQFDASMRLLYANAAGARLIKIEDSNHFIQIDQPARFVAEVDAFMRR
jgi:pimeloyl-ACP methyl ester carboxylesterase